VPNGVSDKQQPDSAVECRRTLPVEYLLEIVEYGILQPSGQTPAEWLFDAGALVVVKRALRLRRDLDLEWAGIALALELMAELEQLRHENSQLKQRLSRFEQPWGELCVALKGQSGWRWAWRRVGFNQPSIAVSGCGGLTPSLRNGSSIHNWT
jgi:chaperone modulatory protein CbpM